MIALFSGLIGFLGSFLPELIKLYKDKKDKEHELVITRMQMEREEKGHQYTLEGINVQADVQSEIAAHTEDKYPVTGNKIMDGLIALYGSSVRPTITYCFFALYALTKYASYVSIKKYYTTLSWDMVMSKMWTSEDMAIFCAVIGYWFGQRALQRYQGKIPSAK